MEIKVKAVDVTGEEKSVAEKEQELLDKHEQSQQETPTQEVAEVKEEEPKAEEPKVEEKIETQSSELKEEDVLKFIGDRYGKEYKSLDELNQQREDEPLPEDVSKYLKYKSHCNRTRFGCR